MSEYKDGVVKLTGLSAEDSARILPDGLILLAYRGSISHGTYVPSSDPKSIDDKDIMGVYLGPREHYLGLHQAEHKEAALAPWDAVSYELRKMVRLLLGQNPNVLSLLWTNEQHIIMQTEEGRSLRASRGLFTSRKVYHSFTGYAYAQLKKMTHLAYEGYMGEKRKALVQEHGYDTKNAAHCIRLLRMGIEFLREGELHVFREDAPQLIEIKRGAWTLERVQAEAEALLKRAEQAYDASTLPAQPDEKGAERLLMDILSHHLHGG